MQPTAEHVGQRLPYVVQHLLVVIAGAEVGGDDQLVLKAVLALDKLPDRESFPHLFRALENSAILDEVSDLFVRHKQLYRDLLEEAWRTADSRREVVIAAILQAMKEK